MNCGFDPELLSMHVDGALKGEDRLRVERHIGGCEECRQVVEEMRRLGEVLHSLPREGAPKGLIERIIAEAESGVQRSGWEVAMSSVRAIWTVTIAGFEIEDERADRIRREVPEWVARWVMFV